MWSVDEAYLLPLEVKVPASQAFESVAIYSLASSVLRKESPADAEAGRTVPDGTMARTGAIGLYRVRIVTHADPLKLSISPLAALKTSRLPDVGIENFQAEPSNLAMELAEVLAKTPAGLEPTIY